jgi:hypothetical protein
MVTLFYALYTKTIVYFIIITKFFSIVFGFHEYNRLRAKTTLTSKSEIKRHIVFCAPFPGKFVGLRRMNEILTVATKHWISDSAACYCGIGECSSVACTKGLSANYVVTLTTKYQFDILNDS